jgi:tRNA (guanosine-2'-O-)-methyltransferase
MADLTVLIENVEKPHNLSAILRSCDAVGVLEAHAVCRDGKTSTFNSTAQGSQKWVKLHKYQKIESAVQVLKKQGFRLYGTNLGIKSRDYRECDFTGPTAFVLGAEKWGLSQAANNMMDQSIYIPMRGMVQSLNVSVAAATLLFEALRQREKQGLVPDSGEGMSKELYEEVIFEWAYPEVAQWCQLKDRKYPSINSKGEITEDLPRTVKLTY